MADETTEETQFVVDEVSNIMDSLLQFKFMVKFRD